MDKEQFRITNDNHEIILHLDQVQQLMQQVYWAKERDMGTIEKAVKNSNCYAIFDNNNHRMVAFTRTITDYATMYYLADVIVDQQYRGSGLGKKLVECVVNDTKLNGLYGLLLTEDAQGLYKKYGFGESPETCMFHPKTK